MILLGTCVLFWLECHPARIPTAVKDIFQGTDSNVHASAISAFELGLKIRNKQLESVVVKSKVFIERNFWKCWHA